ncbi:response regulator [Streptomonospora salina]|uniref:DNA-binding NarL/FixJ family response regulator n=1 Tax=Streptomonospora salina TaxID=104205 RepID=A0A841EBW5_9ACTN|nr:response regulator transcription factor [Streptomonospora salina]MBB6000476.1 DNA-binding NarL/FixJ family response regulator [Streptomonospora salina]
MTREAVRVFIVDDQVLLRHGLRKLLEVEEDVEIVGDAADGVEALEFLWTADDGERPDVALVDARMPRMDGVALIERLTEQYPRVSAVVLTTFDDDYIFGGMHAGARGYLLKDTPPDELVSAIRRAARGETVLGGAAAQRIVGALFDDSASGAAARRDYGADSGEGDRTSAESAADTGLSEREAEVARLVGTGASNREIARTLFITEGTAKNHVTSILRKLDLRDRTQLAVWVNRPQH